jgi:GNAT superfamily N-acetyltransferase
MSFQIIKITRQAQVSSFHQLTARLYQDNPYYRPPFRFEIENVFDPQKNERFQKGGECERFLVMEGSDVVGRFALFIDPEKDDHHDPKLGGIGFIEMEDKHGIAEAIINFGKEWHKEKGYEGFRGPINFGENDTFWGILIDGFEDHNVYGMLYHYEYYEELIKQTAPEKFDDVYMYQMDMSNSLPDRLAKITDRLKSRDNIEVRPIDKKNLERDGEMIRQIYNQAFHNQVIEEREEEFIGITRETIRQMIKKLKPVLMPGTSPIVFVDGEPASFLVSVPDLHEISAKTGGTLKWWQLYHLIGFKKRAQKFRPLAFGTVPKYRGRGLEALVFAEGLRWTKEHYPNIETLEGGFVSEKNWIMRRSLEAFGCEIAKTYRVYKWMVGD